MTYTYNPELINEFGVNRMRFELGDTLVEGGADTSALSDEEYLAMIAEFSRWEVARLRLLRAIVHKLSYQVDTRVDTLSYSLSDRARAFRELYDKLKEEYTLAHGKPWIQALDA